MPQYLIKTLPAVEQDIRNISEPVRSRVIDAISALADTPRPPGMKKMEGYRNVHRIRVGHYRVAYEIHDRILLVLIAAAGNRDTIYKLLKRRV